MALFFYEPFYTIIWTLLHFLQIPANIHLFTPETRCMAICIKKILHFRNNFVSQPGFSRKILHFCRNSNNSSKNSRGTCWCEFNISFHGDKAYQGEGISPMSLNLAPPTLDDVFLKVTGEHLEEAEEKEGAVQ